MVEPLRWQVPRRVNVLSAAILIGSVGLGYGLYRLGLVDSSFALRMLWTATGWSFGYVMVGVGRAIATPRYVWVGVIGGLVSTPLVFLSLTFGQVAALLGLLWCLVLAASGLTALRCRLLTTQEAGSDG